MQETYGNWTILQKVDYRKWKAQCSCGRMQNVDKYNVVNGKSKKCRHCCKNNLLPEGKAAFNFTFNGYVRSAAKRGHNWGLTREQFFSLTQTVCFYCGCLPSNKYGECSELRLNGVFVGNGIDRVDSSLGYSISNCVSCCKTCNYMKRSLSFEEFKAHILRIAAHVEAL